MKNKEQILRELKRWGTALGIITILALIACFAWILDEIKVLVTEYCIEVFKAPVKKTPLEMGIEYEEITVRVEEGVNLKVWYIPGKIKDPVILAIPGYEGTRETILPGVGFLHEAGYTLIAIDPRGQGESDGNCICGSYLADDIRAIMNFFKETKGIEHFVLYGISLGGVGAIIAGAQEKNVIGVIADSAFANIRWAFRHSPTIEARIIFDNPILYGLLKHFGPIYIHNAFNVWIDPLEKTNALKHVAKVKNLLLIHGKYDTFIPLENAQLLFEEAQKTPGVKILWVYEGEHGEGLLRYPQDYKAIILTFLFKILEGYALLFSLPKLS